MAGLIFINDSVQGFGYLKGNKIKMKNEQRFNVVKEYIHIPNSTQMIGATT